MVLYIAVLFLSYYFILENDDKNNFPLFYTIKLIRNISISKLPSIKQNSKSSSKIFKIKTFIYLKCTTINPWTGKYHNIK